METQETRTSSILQPLMMAAMVLALGAMAFVQVKLQHQENANGAAITQLAQQQQARIDALEARAASIEQDTSVLRTQTSASAQDFSTKLKGTQKNVAAARTLALTQIQKEHDLTAEQISAMAKQEESHYGEVTTDVTAVKGNLDEAKAHLQTVSSKLDTTIGDLGVQSGLIAKNHEELSDLKRRGERNYSEFDLKKGKDFSRVSDLGLRLTKTDIKAQRYTVSVMVADKRLEKKDKTALEPVQLYLPDGRKLVEIVVWDVNKDRVTGYVSSPKI